MREFENQLLKRASRWRAGPLFGATALLLSSVVSLHAQESPRQQHTGDLASFVAEANAVRDRFKAMGIEYGFVYTSEVLGNVSGGLRRGAIYDGKLDTTFQADLGKLAGWEGLTFYANVFQLHGTGRLKAEYTGAINTNSNIEALQTTRLSYVEAQWRPYFAEAYLFTGTIFFLLCFSLSRLSMKIERKLSYA
ncbi:MAG: carbohydrate porin [Hyphomicrobium sp.]|nr:carbohydrate porin [Hyphomicrobium sp.]